MASRSTIRAAYFYTRQTSESLLIAAAKEKPESSEVYVDLAVQSLRVAAAELGFDLVSRITAEEAAALAADEKDAA